MNTQPQEMDFGSNLAAYAVVDAISRGRRFEEPAPSYRSEFQRDRDRIIHAAAFRRRNGGRCERSRIRLGPQLRDPGGYGRSRVLGGGLLRPGHATCVGGRDPRHGDVDRGG